MATKKISASAVAKKIGCSNREVFGKLMKAGLLVKKDDAWCLTDAGQEAGAEYRESSNYGRYIVWPADLFEVAQVQDTPLNSTKLGVHFQLSAGRMNKLLAEIGWIERGVKGWHVTTAGKRVGGYEREHHSSGVPYATWPDDIVNNPVLVENVSDITGATAEPPVQRNAPKTDAQEIASFREKFEARIRTMDGHYVRSRAEMAIDNWLYVTGLVHAYERKLPIEEDVYCDFYLPEGKVYIEYWGLENDPRYTERKKTKLGIYRKYTYNLIELTDEDILSLDDVMPRKLLKFGIKAD
ncbi:MAG TPA: glycerol kinase [Lentisphaeria bacterium]|nr:glycerol kinase [Lentisphaeria bacterium]